MKNEQLIATARAESLYPLVNSTIQDLAYFSKTLQRGETLTNFGMIGQFVELQKELPIQVKNINEIEEILKKFNVIFN